MKTPKILGLLAAFATIGCAVAIDAVPLAAQAETQGMDRRGERRDTRQDSRSVKQACKAANNKSRSDCRQDKRQTKQTGRRN